MTLLQILLCVQLPVSGTEPVSGSADDFPAIYNSERDPNARPMSAADAAAGMKLPDGFRVSVFASEPEVQNPIAMAWDDQGRMWVAENFTYAEREQRFDLSLRDRVLVLTDSDNDGRADSRTVFTENVQMLTSVEIGRGGVWLMCPPQLLFIPDADGNAIPDGPTQVVLDGFTVARDNYHNFANGLRWGPDGWLYGRCGHSCPGKIGLPGTADDLRIPLDGGIWRYHPQRHIVEVLCHGTVNPWGHDWDRDGELFFINTVIGHLWHVTPGAHFKESFGESMNPAVYERLDTIADHSHFDTRGNWSDGRGGKANDFGGGHAHIGMMIYQADHWPEQYRDKLFTLNMHGQRANVERLERQGAGYIGRHEPDFLIATDPFFRGLEISTGPDGNVFVVDWSDTGECHEQTGVHRTSGRIYKVSYGEPQIPAPVVKPACLRGPGRLPLLWKQYQSGNTSPALLRELLQDPDEHVRVWAIRLLTDFWPLDTIMGPRKNAVYPEDVETRSRLLRMAAEDESGLVLLTLASVLQRLPVEDRAALASALVQRTEFADDRDLPSIVWYGLIPVGDHDPEKLLDVGRVCRWPAALRWISRNLAARIGKHPEPLNELLLATQAMSAALQDQVLLGLKDAVQGWQRGPRPDSWSAFAASPVGVRNAEITRELSSVFGDGRALDEIRKIVRNGKAEMTMRTSALQTLITAQPDDLQSLCESVLEVRVLNATAARGLALSDDPAIGRLLARSYRRFQAEDRPGVLEILVSRPVFVTALLESIGQSSGGIPSADLTPFHVRQIRSLNDVDLNRRLAEVWGELRETPADRAALISQFRDQLSAADQGSPDLRSGRALFRKTCAQCHVLFGDGSRIGPELTGSQRSSLDYLLENILDPSAVVGKDYRMSIVTTTDGRVLNGLVVSKDDKSLVLQTQTDKLILARNQIEEVRETTLSPMPDGLLQNLTSDQVRNLFAYLRHPNQVELP